MKFILLAAAAVIAMPAIAQTSGSTGTSSPTNTGGQGTPTETRNSATDATPATPPPAAADTTMAAPAPAAPVAPAGDPVGGYQPAGPALSGPVTPGATVTFTPAPSPDQAYPAPAPLAKYPVCKKGQYDKCIQRGGK